MRRIVIRAGAACAFLAMLISVNLHLVVLQGVAWTGMLMTYSARSGIQQGIQETFDGEHPCPMCTIIKKARTGDAGRPDAFHPVQLTTRVVAVTSIPFSLSDGNKGLCRPCAIAPDRSGRLPDPPPIPPPRLMA